MREIINLTLKLIAEVIHQIRHCASLEVKGSTALLS